jgi:uncharacterized protein
MKKILLSTMLCLTLNFAATFDEGTAYYNNGDYGKAYSIYEELALKNDAVAQFNLGLMYVKGQIVKQDYLKAKEWYEKAAIKGYSDAQLNLGVMYYNGQGVNVDKFKAYELLLKAAKQGNSKAQRNLDIVCKQSPWACK